MIITSQRMMMMLEHNDNHHRRIQSYCCQGECSHPCIGTNPLPRGQSGRDPQLKENNNDDHDNYEVDHDDDDINR